MNKNCKIILISSILIFALTIFPFFNLTKKRIDITWLGFTYILIAELLLFGGLILIEYLAHNNSQIIIRVGIGFTIISYAIVSIVTSIVYMKSANNSIHIFMVIQNILIVIMFIISFIFYAAAKAFKVDNDKILDTSNRMLNIIGKLNLLKSNNHNKQFEMLIGKIIDSLKYSDISTTVSCDDELELKVTKLEKSLLKDNEGKEKEITELLDEIMMIINRRNQAVKNAKVGGI